MPLSIIRLDGPTSIDDGGSNIIVGEEVRTMPMTEMRNLKSGTDNLHVARLEIADASAFSGMTYPGLAVQLDRLSDSWIAIGAWSDDQPVGLALGHIGPNEKGELRSLFVDPDRRCQGLGRRLVCDLSQVMRSTGAVSISARIGGRNPSRPALERALAKLDWSPLKCVEIRVIGRAGSMAREGGQWKSIRSLLDHGAVTFDHWTDFGEQDWQAFDALVRAAGLKRPSRYYLAIDGLEPRVSVVLRHAGVPVGWVVGRHGLAPMSDGRRVPAIAYASAYLEPTLARRGFMIGGFWHALTRQAEAFGPESLAVFQTPTPRVIALSQKWLVPLALETNEVLESVMPLR